MGIDIVSVFNPPKEEPKLSWRNVFDPKMLYGHYDRAREVAKSVGYSMLAFNGKVYHVNDQDMRAICDVSDLQ